MNNDNPYQAPQTPLKTSSEAPAQLPPALLPFDFAKGANTLLFTAWNPLSFILLNVVFAIHESLVPLCALIIFAIAIRGYVPFCRAETTGKNVFLVVTAITAVCYLLFAITLFRLFSYHENALRNTLLLWLIGNALLMIGISLVAREYRQWNLRNWAILATAFSLLLFASVLPLQTQWLGFEVLHRYAAWYYFVGISFYLVNVVVLVRLAWGSPERSEPTE